MTGRAGSVTSGSRGAAREGDSMSARTRAEREGQDVYYKGRSGEDTETLNGGREGRDGLCGYE